jgi:phosphoadenosine phosphosulfate reductase
MRKERIDLMHGEITRIQDNILKSKEVIKEAIERYGVNQLAIAWTGGKDSTLMLWLYRLVCQELSISFPSCMFIDEGDLFGEIVNFVGEVEKDWNVQVVVAKNHDVASKAKALGDIVRVADLDGKNRIEIEKLGYGEESFPFEPESYVCNHLMKTVAMNSFIEDNGIEALSTGIRWDEQSARIMETYFSPRSGSGPDHTRVHPILHFTERDIWNTTHHYKIPFCPLYYQGYRSLGVKSNTSKFSDLPAWEQDLEHTTEREGRGAGKEEIMAKLRDLGYM